MVVKAAYYARIYLPQFTGRGNGEAGYWTRAHSRMFLDEVTSAGDQQRGCGVFDTAELGARNVSITNCAGHGLEVFSRGPRSSASSKGFDVIVLATQALMHHFHCLKASNCHAPSSNC
jgi:hypothetical protein